MSEELKQEDFKQEESPARATDAAAAQPAEPMVETAPPVAQPQASPPEQAAPQQVHTQQEQAEQPDVAPSEPAPQQPSPVVAEMVEDALTSATGTEPTPTEADSRPSERIKIGGRTIDEPAAPKPTTPGPGGDRQREPNSPPPGKYPPPNIRSQLSDDLQAEFDAVIAGQEVGDLLENASSREAVRELPPETRLTGTISKIHGEDVFVDLGGVKQGLLPMRQFGETAPEVGAQVEVVVIKLNADEGYYEVTMPTGSVDVGNWDEVQEGQVVEVNVTGVNKGGLECQVAGIRGFMPMGQISIYRVEQPEEYVGQRLSCVITEAKKSRKNLVLSHRALMERERAENKEKLLAELAPGQTREGVVRSLRDFGAFVDLGGVDGMVHVSKLSWERVNHPKDVLTEGQTIKVKVEKIDRETGKIALSYRESVANPWETVEADFPVGSTAKGTVSKTMDFGAFVRLAPGVEGLIHISELDHGRVMRTTDVVSEGQQVEAKVMSVDLEKQRIGLSLRALMAKPEREQPKREYEPEPEPQDDRPRIDRTKLKGGMSHKSGGDKFGLRW